MGCFAKGCLTVIVLALFFCAALVGTAWYVYHKVVTNLTFSEQANVPLEPPTEAQLQSAESARTRVKQAMANNEETTVEFTGSELNALLAREDDFKELRGRARIEIADSLMTIVLSVPLDGLHWRKLRGRWFNGTARFGITYESGRFHIDLKSADAAGHSLPMKYLTTTWLKDSLDDGLNESFEEKFRDQDSESNFWKHVKSIKLSGDKLVITTQAR
jgi:hypothetical protein